MATGPGRELAAHRGGPLHRLHETQYGSPRLFEASCTVPSIMARYIENEIDKIPDADVEAARAGGHPTAMVIGPGYFVEPIHRFLKEGKYPQAGLRRSEQISVQPVDTYRRLARDEESNLGWRILVHL